MHTPGNLLHVRVLLRRVRSEMGYRSGCVVDSGAVRAVLG